MAEMILPGVYIEVRPEKLIVPGRVTVGNLGVVGTASKGRIGQPILLGSYSEARERFGNYDAFVDGKSNELTLARALEHAFNHGASTVFAVRVTGTEPVAPGENFIAPWNKNTKARKATFTVAGETGATVAATLKARTHGTWGNAIEVNVFDAEDDGFIVDEKRAQNRLFGIEVLWRDAIDHGLFFNNPYLETGCDICLNTNSYVINPQLLDRFP